MILWIPLSLWAFLLLLPAILAPRRPKPEKGVDAGEIRGSLRLLHALFGVYCRFYHRLTIDGTNTLPATGPAILIANHTCGIDHVLLQSTTRRLLGFMIAKEYYEWVYIHRLCRFIQCIPVKRDGHDFSATRAGLRALERGRVLPIFPEGHITPASGRGLDVFKPGCAYLALRAKVPIVPVYITGTPETDDIIKSLITPSSARLRFGDVIDLSDLWCRPVSDRAAIDEISNRLRAALLDLQAHSLAAQAAAGE
jgi:1-acyl-sn-glycerol-3-phosphate acyltransferase